jgi:hypothetical protein
MRFERNDSASPYGRGDGASFEARPYDRGYRTGENQSDPEIFYGAREQVQEFADESEEYGEPPYVDGDVGSYDGEKLTNLPARRSHKGLWAFIALAALFFFLLAGGAPRFMLADRMQGFHREHSMRMYDGGQILFNPSYAWIGQQTIAAALHLDTRQIAEQLREGRSLSDVASGQGISADQLQDIELQAMKKIYAQAITDSAIDQHAADRQIDRFQDEPQALNKVAPGLFFVGSFEDDEH